MTSRTILILAAPVLLLAGDPSSRPQFRAGTEVVTVDVLVKNGNVPITDLNGQDFELKDNGVVQQVQVARAATVPVDLTLVLDVSSSVKNQIDEFKTDIRQIAELLRPDDRVRLLTFSGETTQLFGFQPGSASVSFEGLKSASGQTALDDTLLLALAWIPESSRRHLVAAFTDGAENSSFIERRDFMSAASHAPGLLYIAMSRPVTGAVPESRTAVTTSGTVSVFMTEGGDTLRTAAESTGGGLLISQKSQRILDGFKTVFETFRSGYVLHYTPRGVDRPGWHELTVTVTKSGKYDVHARKGYAGG